MVDPAVGQRMDRSIAIGQRAKFAQLALTLDVAYAGGVAMGEVQYAAQLQGFWPAGFLHRAAADGYVRLSGQSA
ncbi:hypothetical protein [Glutamicibacter arilaitensis]|uniref:hypothetical protein n=1 Tax=Glutamicibacter arilaitensis TaxID=256701 RepID=UPI00384BAE30